MLGAPGRRALGGRGRRRAAELRGLDPGAGTGAKNRPLGDRNLRDPRGFFHYQRRRLYTVRTPYMRWSQGWMPYALARFLEVSSEQ